jgi:hypothetical protein
MLFFNFNTTAKELQPDKITIIKKSKKKGRFIAKL